MFYCVFSTGGILRRLCDSLMTDNGLLAKTQLMLLFYNKGRDY